MSFWCGGRSPPMLAGLSSRCARGQLGCGASQLRGTTMARIRVHAAVSDVRVGWAYAYTCTGSGVSPMLGAPPPGVSETTVWLGAPDRGPPLAGCDADGPARTASGAAAAEQVGSGPGSVTEFVRLAG